MLLWMNAGEQPPWRLVLDLCRSLGVAQRQRSLRSMGRFVAQSVCVALATTSHHSFDSRAGVSVACTVHQRVSELERMLETDLVSCIAAVEVLVETLQGDISRGRSELNSSLEARLCAVSDEMNSNVATVSQALKTDVSRARSELCSRGSAFRCLWRDPFQILECCCSVSVLVSFGGQASRSGLRLCPSVASFVWCCFGAATRCCLCP